MNVYATVRPGPGALLVAAPSITDPHFERTVVQVLRHDDADGTLGVVINRPSPDLEPTLTVALGDWLSSAAPPATVFNGGPVASGSFLCLSDDSGSLRSVDLTDEDPHAISGRWRVFRGYAGWGGGQLQAEIEEAGWYVVPSRVEDVFTSEPERLWRAVLARQSGDVRMFADFPEDPGLN